MPEPGEVDDEQLLRRRALDAARRAGDLLLARSDGPAAERWRGTRASPAGRPPAIGELDASIYDGVAGIAVVSSALSAATGSSAFAELAIAASGRLRELATPEVLATLPLGLEGLGGITWAALQSWRVLDDDDSLATLRTAASVLHARCERLRTARAVDLIGGEAGALLALLALVESETIPLDSLRASIANLIDLLVDAAEPADPCGRCWSIFDERLPIVGAGHGTSGIAYALHRSIPIATHRADEISRLVDDVVAYEDASINAEIGNWVDPRWADAPDQMNTWCYGAAGVRLVRAALGIAGPEGCIDAWTDDILPVDHLCCGTAGRLEATIATAGLRSEPAIALIDELCTRTLDSTARVERVDHVLTTSTGLFRGLPGVAYTLLRVATPDTHPSVLLLE